MVDKIGISLFLGSGASASVGLPTTNALMNTLIGRHQDDKYSFLEEYRHSDVEILDNDMREIEQTQNKIVNNLRAKYDSGFLETIPKLRQEIRSCLFTELKSTPDREREYQLMLGELIQLMHKNNSKVNIITTNYDMLVEKVCALSGIVVADGFRTNASSMSAFWDNHWPDNPVDLVKLHGSINWHIVDDRITKESISSIHEPSADVLIAPTLEPKTYVDKPFDDLWKRFKHILEGTSLLVVIGFSFRDKELVNRIKESIGYGVTVLSVSPTATKDAEKAFGHCVGLIRTHETILSSDNKYSPVYTFDSRFGNSELPSIFLALNYVVTAIHKHNSTITYTEI